jgi:hypothetical protein
MRLLEQCCRRPQTAGAVIQDGQFGVDAHLRPEVRIAHVRLLPLADHLPDTVYKKVHLRRHEARPMPPSRSIRAMPSTPGNRADWSVPRNAGACRGAGQGGGKLIADPPFVLEEHRPGRLALLRHRQERVGEVGLPPLTADGQHVGRAQRRDRLGESNTRLVDSSTRSCPIWGCPGGRAVLAIVRPRNSVVLRIRLESTVATPRSLRCARPRPGRD